MEQLTPRSGANFGVAFPCKNLFVWSVFGAAICYCGEKFDTAKRFEIWYLRLNYYFLLQYLNVLLLHCWWNVLLHIVSVVKIIAATSGGASTPHTYVGGATGIVELFIFEKCTFHLVSSPFQLKKWTLERKKKLIFFLENDTFHLVSATFLS